jgi:hypothetical protein
MAQQIKAAIQPIQSIVFSMYVSVTTYLKPPIKTPHNRLAMMGRYV